MKNNFGEMDHVDEPLKSQEFSDVLTRVVSSQQPVIVRRGGDGVAAVIPLGHLELLQEVFAQQKAERLAAQLDWSRLVKDYPPSQAWFDGDEPKPF